MAGAPKGSQKRKDAAKKAAETRRLNAQRARQGLGPVRGAKARRARQASTPSSNPPAAPTIVASTTPSSPAAGGSSGSAASAIASRIQAVAAPAAAAAQATAPVDPALAAALGATAQLVQPTWENDGKWLRVWTATGLKRVQLPVEAKPGPFTPQEDVHDVLGQPDLLFTLAVGMAENFGVLVEGPTSTAKSTAPRWLAKQLNYNLLVASMHKDVAAEDLVGEYLPVESKTGETRFKWIWGSVAKAVLASQEHPTILVFEELNRVGNLQVFARLYSLLDDTRQLIIDNKEGEKGLSEVLRPGKLYVVATQNPVDHAEDDMTASDYIGVQELDPALRRRFPLQMKVGYPPEEIEAEALRRRVKGLSLDDAKRMVKAATRVRESPECRYPFGFMDLVAWATALPYYGYQKAAEVGVIAKAHPTYQAGMRDLMALAPTAAGVTP